VPAINRAAYLISEVAGGKVANDVIKAFSDRQRPRSIPLSLDYSNRLLGTSLSKSEVERCISLPGYKVKSSSRRGSGNAGAGWVVSPPSWRVDLSQQEDLIEEVARLTGYDSIPSAMPEVPMSVSESQKGREFETEVRALLSHCGCHEVITYSFISTKSLDMLRVAEGSRLKQVLPLRNPLAEDQSVMRTSLIPGLLQALTVNVRLRNMDVKIFEIPDWRSLLPVGLLASGTRAVTTELLGFRVAGITGQ
jgi:phenylalanyl-tRNA synthetase beta chain